MLPAVTYYQVLEIGEQATAREVRQAYLRLVRLTHPDRTPDPAAHARYLLVNEAYDILSQPERRAHYDARLRQQRAPASPRLLRPFEGNAFQVLRVPYSATPAQIDGAYRHWSELLRRNQVDPALRKMLADVEQAYATLRDPVLRQHHYARVRGQRLKTTDPYALIYTHLVRYARPLCWVLAVFALLLVPDRFLTLSFPNEPVLALRFVPDHDFCCEVRTPNARFRIHSTDQAAYFDVKRSALFQQVRAYRPRHSSRNFGSWIDYTRQTIYGAAFFLPLIMGICGILGSLRRSSVRVVVNCAVAGFILAVIVASILLTT